MATADQLLASVSEVDKTLVIDSDLRSIVIPSSVKNLGVESDDDVLKLDFKMPGTYCGIDLSTFSVRINYLNANAEPDVYDARDAKLLSDGMIHFSWLVGRHATMYKGSVKFNVCLKEADSEGIVLREFNTTIATLNVLEGLETNAQVVAQYADIFEQWRSALFGLVDTEEARLLAVSQTQQEAIAAEGNKQIVDIKDKGVETLATIPEDYTHTYNAAEEALRTKADAIVLNAKGETVVLENASNGYLQGLKLFGKTEQAKTTGKNLLNIQETESLTNVLGVNVTLPAGTYIVTLTSETHSGNQPPHLRFYTNNVWVQLKDNLTQSVVLSQDETQVYIYTYGMSAAESVGVSAVFNQLMISTTGGEWEPYTGGLASPRPDYPQAVVSLGNNGKVDTKVCGKNLLNINSTPTLLAATSVVDGNSVTVTTADDTSLSRSVFKVDYPLNKELVISFDATVLQADTINAGSTVRLRKGSKSTGIIMLDLQSIGVKKHYEIKTAPITEDGFEFWLYLRTTSDYAGTISVQFDNIQIEVGDSATEYESYKESRTSSISTPNGLSGIPVDSDGNYTDSNGQQWICDEVDFKRGVYIQRIQSVTLDGTEIITKEERNNGANYRWIIRVANPVRGNPYAGGYCTHFPYNLDPIGNNITDDVICIWTTGYIYARYDAITTAEDMTAWLVENYEAGTPIKIQYVLETPIETKLTAAEIQGYKALRTSHPNTTIWNDAGALMDLDYAVDTRMYIDENGKPVVWKPADLPVIPSWVKQENKPTYTASEVGADPKGTATDKVSEHNVSDMSHNDIRLLIDAVNNRLNGIADSDDTTLDQLSEIVTYIKCNKELIDSITTSKINVADIIDNCTTPVSDKPLSAKQGVELLTLINNHNKSMFDSIYPIGSIYIGTTAQNPENLFGGVWRAIEDRFLLAAGREYVGGKTGGEAAHALTTEEMPRHNHGIGTTQSDLGNTLYTHYAYGIKSIPEAESGTKWYTAGTQPTGGIEGGGNGNSAPHNNMPPYLVVFMWERIA